MRKWRASELERLAELAAAHVPLAQIAIELRRTTPSVKDKIRYLHERARRPAKTGYRGRPRKPHTPDNAIQSLESMPRHCLCCTRTFVSEWIGNRICVRCKNTEMF